MLFFIWYILYLDLLGCKCQDLASWVATWASREQIAADNGHLHFSCTTCDPPLITVGFFWPKFVSIKWLTDFPTEMQNSQLKTPQTRKTAVNRAWIYFIFSLFSLQAVVKCQTEDINVSGLIPGNEKSRNESSCLQYLPFFGQSGSWGLL